MSILISINASSTSSFVPPNYIGNDANFMSVSNAISQKSRSIEAAIKIGTWYRECKQKKDLREYNIRNAFIQNRGISPQFTVERIFGQKKKEALIQEIGAISDKLFKKEFKEKTVEEANQEVWHQIFEGLTEPSYVPIVVRDQKGVLQAAALISTEEIEEDTENPIFQLVSIATAPENLGPNGRYRGAATAAIEDAFYLCIRWRFEYLKISRDRIALPFYNRIGITEDITPIEKFSNFHAQRGGKARPLFNG